MFGILTQSFSRATAYQFDWPFEALFPIFCFGGAGIFGILALAFWIWMIVDCATKTFPNNDKIIWILVVVLAGWVGALIYFFVGRSKGRPS